MVSRAVVAGAREVVAGATQEQLRHPLSSYDHVGISSLRKHWHAPTRGHDGAVEARTVEAARVGATGVLATAPQLQELGQPRASVAQVITAPEGQSQLGMEPQRAVVGAAVVGRAVVGATVVARAVVGGAAVDARAVVGAAVEGAAVVSALGPAWQ